MSRINKIYRFFLNQVPILSLFFLINCQNNQRSETLSRETEILRVDSIIYTRSEFENTCNEIEKSGISKDSSIKRLLYAYLNNALILKHLNKIGYELSDGENKELTYINRKQLIQLTENQALNDIKINERDVQKEIDIFRGKQILVDYIWFPKKSKELIDECYSIFNSGGIISDMVYSDKQLFERITSVDGEIKRVNVEPGMFSNKISEFVTNGQEGDVKKIKTEDGYYIIKIIYKKTDNFLEWDFQSVELNMQKAAFYANETNKVKSSEINLTLLNATDFNFSSIDPNNQILAEFNGKTMSLQDIKDKVKTLPFHQQILFSNKSCSPSAVVALILLESKRIPVTSNDLYNELISNRNNKLKTGFDNLYEIQYLLQYEKSNFYPWLFPFLFVGHDSVKINYGTLYNCNLVDYDKFRMQDTLAMGQNSVPLTVENFIDELKIISGYSIAQLLQVENAVKMIHYYFESNHNIPSSLVNINTQLLKNVLIFYSQDLVFDNFAIGTLSNILIFRTRKPYFEDVSIVNSSNLSLSINKLKSILQIYPTEVKSLFSSDVVGVSNNKYWRYNALKKIIEDEKWLQLAEKFKIQQSKIYQNLEKRNANKMLVNSYLNSEFKLKGGSVFSSLYSDGLLLRDIGLWYDPGYFKQYSNYIKEITTPKKSN